jgi:hypothetical protein
VVNIVTADQSNIDVTANDERVSVNIQQHDISVVVGTTGPQGPRGTQVLTGMTDPSPVIGLIGDQYINVNTGFIFGPKTESGWGSGSLLGGGGTGLTISDVSFTFYQVVPSAIWVITHNLGFTPSITVVDLNGKVIEGDYQYGTNNITATFSESITGAAYLS